MSRVTRALVTIVILAMFSWGAAAWAGGPSSIRAVNAQPDLAEVSRLIGVFESRIADHTDALDYRTLGGHYLTRAGLTGSLTDYHHARTHFDTAVQLAPEVVSSRLGLAAASAALHDFTASLDQAATVTELEPTNAAAWLLVGDAHLELGAIDDAEGAFARAPASDPSVMVRYAELAHLRGQQDEAIRLAGAANRQARHLGLEGRSLAFHLLFEADLRFDAGEYESAHALSAEAIDLDPTWAPSHASLAKALTALHEFSTADAAYQTALALQPGDAGWIAARGDLAGLRGDVTQSNQLAAEAESIYLATAPEIYGRSLAMAWADGGVNLSEALALAEADLERRQDIGAYDTLAWVLYRMGRFDDAAEASAVANRFGTEDGELRFHSAMISAAVGETEEAAAQLGWLLETNPEFHPVHRSTAHQTLEALAS